MISSPREQTSPNRVDEGGDTPRRENILMSTGMKNSPIKMYEESTKFIEGTMDSGASNRRGRLNSKPRKKSQKKIENAAAAAAAG